VKYLVVFKDGSVHKYFAQLLPNRRKAIKWAKGYSDWKSIELYEYHQPTGAFYLSEIIR